MVSSDICGQVPAKSKGFLKEDFFSKGFFSEVLFIENFIYLKKIYYDIQLDVAIQNCVANQKLMLTKVYRTVSSFSQSEIHNDFPVLYMKNLSWV